MKWHRKKFLKTLVWAGVSGHSLMQTAFAKQQAPASPTPEKLPVRIREAVYAFAVADAMGGSIENMLPDEIEAQFGHWDFHQFLPPTNKKDIGTGKGKGDGRITDDTLNLEVLIRIYHRVQNHLDAYEYAAQLVAEQERKVWIPDKGLESRLVDRPLWWPERYVYQRLAIHNVEPRQAGIGNYINEGFQGIMLPVGAVNAGDPWRAYTEVAGFGAAHTESYGLEAAAVNAACYAYAFGTNPSIEGLLQLALDLAKDGSKPALQAALNATNPFDTQRDFIRKTRTAIMPYLQTSPEQQLTPERATPKLQHSGTNIGRASRTGVVENFPIALAALKFGGGDYEKTLKASLFYGRDGENIAAVSTSLLAAMPILAAVPDSLKKQVNDANQRNYDGIATMLWQACSAIYQADQAIADGRKKLMETSAKR